MMSVFLMLIIAVIVAGVLWWLISFIPVPEPFNRLAKGLIMIALVFFIVMQLWGLRGALLK